MATVSTLAQVMACCLKAPSHYPNQYWLIISKVLWLSCEGNFTRDTPITNHKNLFETHMSKIPFKFPRPQWVKVQIQTALTQHRACSHTILLCADALVPRDHDDNWTTMELLCLQKQCGTHWDLVTITPLTHCPLEGVTMIFTTIAFKIITQNSSLHI